MDSEKEKIAKSIKSAFETTQMKLLTTAKFVKQGTKLRVRPQVPKDVEVEGRFGKRKMYIIDTQDFGLVYVTPLQFLHICEVFNGDYSQPVTVEI
jgi:hypothetical protein